MKTNFLPGKALQIITILLMLPILAFGQMQSFVSKVVDAETGEALPYVSVYAKQNRTGTVKQCRGIYYFFGRAVFGIFHSFLQKKRERFGQFNKNTYLCSAKRPRWRNR